MVLLKSSIKKHIQSFLRKYFRNPCNPHFQAVSRHRENAGKNNFPVCNNFLSVCKNIEIVRNNFQIVRKSISASM